MTRRLLIVLVLLGVFASGCSLGPRETWADSMRNAFENAAKIGSSRVHVTVSMRVIQTVIRVVPSTVFSSADGVVDYKDRTNKLTAKSSYAPSGVPVFYDDLVTYLPRSVSARQDHNPNLPWACYDFKRKPKPDTIDATDRLASLGYVIAPSLALELLQGVLAGSLKEAGTSQMDGDSVTEYSGKLAPDGVTRDLREQQRVDGITRMFKLLGSATDLFPVHVWMDQQGFVHRIQFLLKQREDVVDQFRTTLDYTFTKPGPSTAMVPPSSDLCLRHKRFVDTLNEYTRASV